MRRIGTTAAIICALAIGLAPSQSRAWGDIGHKVVCAIAFAQLNGKARAEVTRLIGLDSAYPSFSASCVWPDHPKRRRIEHYINVPRTTEKITSGKCPNHTKCLFSAIAFDLNVLRNSTDDTKKLESLKYLGHWIGDLHQPLHVSFADDRGGGGIGVQGLCNKSSNGYHSARNLHAVWDSCIIEHELGLHSSDIAVQLLKDINGNLAVAGWKKGTVANWANESFQEAEAPDVDYCVKAAHECDYQAGQEFYEKDKKEKSVLVDQDYLDAHAKEVRQRLEQAGVRLAMMLNRTLGK